MFYIRLETAKDNNKTFEALGINRFLCSDYIIYHSDQIKTCIKIRQLVFKCVLLDYFLDLISVSYLFGKIIVIPIKTREAKKKEGGEGLDKKKGSFSNLKGHLTLPKPNLPLKTPISIKTKMSFKKCFFLN